ncbi:hypothetical protein [Prosthecodimorpha staleyi]|uniref:Uncharacterized protein n=1 Tax=Prosthecodimorpha staleyi TaxID=2840188 RepID=A0A947DAU4_9HYPH|nr:hypothetical protein [Prosthecodimorpha staleyi]MBT9293336.1 hypothetical protein [Prosthecodimorpha staleyi]
MTPVSLADLVAADPLGTLKAAIVARLATLITGIAVASHPGRLDISEVTERAIVQAPGIAVGWSRIRGAQMLDGSVHLPIDWVAYLVVADKAIGTRAVDRERIGLALGRRLLQILPDRDAATWGLTGVTPPAVDPGPEFRPLFTVSDAAKGAAYYAVTWTQSLIDQGTGLFDGPEPLGTEVLDGDGRPAIDFDFGEGVDPPPEVLALFELEG